MTIGNKILSGALASVVVTVAVALVIQHAVITKQGIERIRDNMRAAVLEAENVRATMSQLSEAGAFDRPKLFADYKKTGDLPSSALYKTIPVVAAWDAIAEVAKKENYDFRVPKHSARNPKNTPRGDEAEILAYLEKGDKEEYFRVDKDAKTITYARPIKLTKDCLGCHGDPANSKSGDGKDFLGFPMENWKTGEVHGAFVLKSDTNRIQAIVNSSILTTMQWMIPVSALIGVGFYFLNRRAIERPLLEAADSLRNGSEQIAAASTQVASSAQTLASGATEQAAGLEETSASVEELTSMTKRNSESANAAKHIAETARQAADAGTSAVSKLSTSMTELAASSSDIAKIVKTIDEIAFQTNILALNAAVEAARAGEAGAGFAVVAEEVRALAQRSAAAAKETAAKIETALARSNEGSQIGAEVSQTLGGIIEQVRELDKLVNEVAQASAEQSQGIQQINRAVGQLDRVTQSNAAAAEESASAAEEMSAQSAQLNSLVGDLVLMVAAKERPRLARQTPGRASAPTSLNGIHPRVATPAAKAHPIDPDNAGSDLSAPQPPPQFPRRRPEHADSSTQALLGSSQKANGHFR